jgi:two-component system cell cycle sensor histidine kinase/response regulator CckA
MTDSRGKAVQSILMVDDDAETLVTVGAFLVNSGFVVEKAASGDEALRKIVANPSTNILVTDLIMPGMSGADLITHARRVRPTLKALVITGYPNADELAELPPHASILVKPFRRVALIAEVKSLLSKTPGPNKTEELIAKTTRKAGLKNHSSGASVSDQRSGN